MKNKTGLLLCLTLLAPNAARAFADGSSLEDADISLAEALKKSASAQQALRDGVNAVLTEAAQREEQAEFDELVKKVVPLMVEICDLLKAKNQYMSDAVGLRRDGEPYYVRSTTRKGEAWMQAKFNERLLETEQVTLDNRVAKLRLLEIDEMSAAGSPSAELKKQLEYWRDAVAEARKVVRSLKAKAAALDIILKQDGASEIVAGKDYVYETN